MKGRKRKCMASNIVRRSGPRKKLRTQEDENPELRLHASAFDFFANLFSGKMEEESPSKPETKPTRRIHPIRLGPCRHERTCFNSGSSTMSEEASGQEESPPMPELPHVRRSARLQLKRGKPSSAPEESPVKRKTLRGAEEVSPSELISGPTNGLRRSSRYRVPPLDFWRNQRLVFKSLASGEVQCLGVDEGTEADNYGLIQILKKKETREKKSQKKTVKTVKKTPILDTRKGEMVHKRVHQPFESLQWAVPPSEDNQMATYRIAKTFTSRSNSFGFLDISPFAAKESQYSPTHNLHFVVVKGRLEVTIQDTPFAFTVGDTWIVPMGVPYSIKNYTRAKALVSFSTFKE